jgi:phosphotransferase system enzyme I (PtsP)
MALERDIPFLVDRLHSLSEILVHAVAMIARDMSAEVSAIFLLEPEDYRLHLAAAVGLGDDLVGRVAIEPGGILGEAMAEMRPVEVELSRIPELASAAGTRPGQPSACLCVPIALRNRPIGILAVRPLGLGAYSRPEVARLATICAMLGGVIANARLLDALNHGQMAEDRAAASAPRPRDGEPAGAERILYGSNASPGIAIGEALYRGAVELSREAHATRALGAGKEHARARDAFEMTRNDILRVQRAALHESDEEHATIFSAHLLLLGDSSLGARVERAIDAGSSAHVAIDHALSELARRLQAVEDSYLQERVEDIHDLRSRLLDHLLGGPPRSAVEDRIVVTGRIPPSLVVELKTERARGLVTEMGGTSSHGVLLARSMGIPTVTGVEGVAEIPPRERIIVDGTRGMVIVAPREETVARYRDEMRAMEQTRTEFLIYRDRPACTRDGVRVVLQANVGIDSDLVAASENGAEGVGLYRTELGFIVRGRFPSREEQIRIYARAYEHFPAGPINFRLLDLGGDKFIPGHGVPVSRNAFHGYRSIRVLFDYPHVLRDQVQAFALAAGTRPLRILIPMVTSLEELRRVRELVRESLDELPMDVDAQRQPQFGVMIETPAAVELADHLAREVEFLSIGTNDLIQYSIVVDREDSRMTSPNDYYHPAIVRMIRRTVLAAHAAGKSVTVCGEMTARKEAALLLIALGVDGLSVSPGEIPRLKQAIATSAVEPLRAAADHILSLPDLESVRRTVEACLAAGDDSARVAALREQQKAG